MNSIINDYREYPDLFEWTGPISEDEINDWLDSNSIELPEDLLQLWNTVGGGTMFESELILSPIFYGNVDDDIATVNEWYWENGLSHDYLVFNKGSFLSAIRLNDGKYVLLDSIDYYEEEEFNSLEDWYLNSVRVEFAERYNLS